MNRAGWLGRRLDPHHPFRAERGKGSGVWRSASVACYSAAWQLLLPSMVVLVATGTARWWFFLPSIAGLASGAWCALSDHLEKDALRWWGPWTVLAPAVPGFSYAFGPRHSQTRTAPPS